jgi:riboflavin synthase
VFTGIVEEIGKVKSVSGGTKALRLEIEAKKVLKNLRVSESININGACQTVIEVNKSSFAVEAVEETLRKTNLGQLRSGDWVNLERSLGLSDRLSGHIVTGHIDCVGKIISIERKQKSLIFKVSIPLQFSSYIVEKGSISLEGVSLTMVNVFPDAISGSIIPFTYENTNFKYKKENDLVNVEFDIIGKYIKKMIDSRTSQGNEEEKITEDFLREKGW